MKKLMIAAAMICAAALSYGAAAEWKCSISSTSPVYIPETTTSAKANASALYIFADVGTSFRDNLVDAFAAGTLDLSAQGAVGQATLVNGVLKNGDDSYKVVTAGAVGSNSTLLFAFETIIDGDKYLYISEDVTGLGKDGKQVPIAFKEGALSIAKAQDASAGYSANGWYTAVPEPTSGLLLLLGVAGLALRRRRA